MSFVFPQRCDHLERMDTEPIDTAVAVRVLRALQNVNAMLGGVRATLWHLNRLAKRWRVGETIRFIDWGIGGADIPRAIVDWGRRRGFRLEVLGIDSNSDIIEEARTLCRDYPEIQLQAADAAAFTSDANAFDYAISSLTLHHLSDLSIIELLRKSDRIARRGIVMNDLERNAAAWGGIWLLTRLLGAHPIVQNDGPLSVRRAFTKPELEYFARQAGLPYLKVHRHFVYRFTLAGEKNR